MKSAGEFGKRRKWTGRPPPSFSCVSCVSWYKIADLFQQTGSRMDYRVYRKVLRMVGELHLRGFQQLRIAPGMSAAGSHWRCAITPVANISTLHGARLISDDPLVANYSTGSERDYFGWTDAGHCTPSELAELFIKRFPSITAAGRGSDWLYAGWYVEMLGLTFPDGFPIGYADWELPSDYLTITGGREGVRIPMPPPGVGGKQTL